MLPVERISLNEISLEELANVFKKDFKNKYQNVEISVEQCPDLTQSPFHLAASGLGGKTAIAVVGGVKNLVPIARKEKIYSFKEIAQQVDISNDMFFIGAGAGPFHKVGINCELMPNFLVHKELDGTFNVVNNQTHLAKLEQNEKGYSLSKTSFEDFALMADMFVSEGKSDKILKIKLQKRLCDEDLVKSIRTILKDNYPNLNISLGGLFFIQSGMAKLHIMPDFKKEPFSNDDEVDNWLKMFNMNSPLICLTVMHSVDSKFDFRMEHTHCFSKHGQGGHYHFDVTPDEVTYIAYLNVAQNIFLIDKA